MSRSHFAALHGLRASSGGATQMRRNLIGIFLVIAGYGLNSSAQQSVPVTPTRASQMSAPGPQRQQPPAGQQPSSSRTAPSPVRALSYPGTVTGYVYWDTKVVQHNPPLACNGLAVTVSVGTPPSGSTPAFEQFKALGTYNNLTYLNNGSTLAVCAYAIKQVPVGQDLQVQITAPPSAFSPVVTPATPLTANNPNGPIKIIGGKCNNLPPAVPSPSVLGSHWWTCGDYAYNVNFVLQAPGSVQLMSAGGGSTLLGQQSVPGTQQPAPHMIGSGTPAQVQSGRSDQKPPLTNADVVKMVKASVPESVIVSSIQSSPAKFDRSPDALLALHRAGVSQKILEMIADGSAKRGAASLKIKLGPAKTSSIVKNPRAVQADAAIIAVLDKQRQAAAVEASQMIKTGVRPAGLTAGPSQPMSATGGSGAQATMPATIQKAPIPGNIPPGTASDVQGNSIASLTHASQVQTIALPCAQDSTMRIFNVSGEFYPATFTPDAKYNFYTITGCSFGDPGPNSKVYIYYQDTFHQEFQIQEWNENGIKLNLDPSLSGLLDHDNLTLVVQRSDGKQATKSGFKFYAARATTRLTRIPSASFSLNHFVLNQTSNLSPPLYTSPSSPSVAPRISGWTAEVEWSSDDLTMDPGEDIYQFKQLQPGFSADSAQMTWVNLDCGDYQFVNLGGNFDLQWVGDDLHATWQAQYCKPINCGGAFQTDCFVSPPSSNYAVNVWATGPRGVDPWTGNPQPPN